MGTNEILKCFFQAQLFNKKFHWYTLPYGGGIGYAHALTAKSSDQMTSKHSNTDLRF